MTDQYEEPAIIRGGWSITVEELKRAIAKLPDDYEVMIENAEVGDIEISNVNINRLYPPSATGSPGLLILGGGQIVNAEYDYDNRMDAHHEFGGDQHWRNEEGWIT